jgi:hypothetical protein
MSVSHSPDKQANWLRQSLAHDKKPLGVLLGAGCPAAIRVDDGQPLIPDIGGLTKIVAGEFESSQLAQPFKLLSDHFLSDHSRQPTIEDLLSFIRALRNVAGKSVVRELSAANLDELDKRICAIVASTVDRVLPEQQTAYHRFAVWAGAIPRSCPVEIFTTNYDLLIEQSMEAYRVPYFDGFVGSHQSFFDTHAIDGDDLPPRWARVWKMHGSINWSRDANGNVVRRVPQRGNDCVIHPSHLKYDESRRMPYIALMDRLRAFLRQPSAFLVTCGFSFRDQHINEVILEALQGNPTATVFGLLRSEISRYPEAVRAAERRANLSILTADAAVIGTRRGAWPDGGTEAPPATSAVEWIIPPAATLPQAEPARKVARFRLGDFNRLGEFFEELIGPDVGERYGLVAK